MKKQNIIMGISFVLLFVMVMGVSYAAYKFSATGTKENVISTGTISMSYKQNSFIDLKNTYPKTDIYAIGTKEDKSSMEFSVSMEVSGTTTINYVLALTEIQEGETLKSDKVKIYLEKEGKVVNNFEENKGQTIESFKNKYVEGLIDSYAIYQDILTTSNKTHHYTLIAWIDESYILPIKNETTTTKQTNEETYKFKVKVVGVDTPITIKEKSNVTTGVDTLMALTNNKNESGLYTITHAADSTLQIGTNESVTEYRYRGARPKNYVTFNNETWRILGVFKADDGTGKIENRIKLIRNESIGNKNWNTSGTNNWTTASLQTELNGTYLTGLTNTSQSMIGNAKYYLGGYGFKSVHAEDVVEATKITGVQAYNYERKIQNENCTSKYDESEGFAWNFGTGCYYYGTNPNNWIGKIGLMYVSDYFYASANCENKILSESYVNNGYAKVYETSTKDIRACNDTNWLYNLKQKELVLPQVTVTPNAWAVLKEAGNIEYTGLDSDNDAQTRPVLYLTSSVKITGGTGTSSDPYTLGL